MGKKTPTLLLYMVLVFLTASVSARGCKAKKACKLLKGSAISADEVCDGQEVQHKTFHKGKNCKCCYATEQKPCPTSPPTQVPTTTVGPPPPIEVKTIKPIIGVLAQELTDEQAAIFPQYKSYIVASYVKFIESGGARVVPIMIDQTDDYYEMMAKSLNGIVFPGGTNSITNKSGYGRAGRKLYDHIIESGNNGNPVPLWATCLGFQMTMYLDAGPPGSGVYMLDGCDASNYAIPLDLKDWESSSLLGSAPDSVKVPLTTMDITSNFHYNCVLPKTFEKYNLKNNYTVVSTNLDKQGLEFISTVEHKTLPIYGFQFHIEKNAYEWKYSKSTPHFPEAIHFGHYFAQLFGDKARQNGNSFSSTSEARSYLIYNHQPIYLTPYDETHDYNPSYPQAYFFE